MTHNSVNLPTVSFNIRLRKIIELPVVSMKIEGAPHRAYNLSLEGIINTLHNFVWIERTKRLGYLFGPFVSKDLVINSS